MKGDPQSVGWMISESGHIGGCSVEIKGMEDKEYNVTWFDPWNGHDLKTESVIKSEKGVLRLTAPALNQSDIVFIIQ